MEIPSSGFNRVGVRVPASFRQFRNVSASGSRATATESQIPRRCGNHGILAGIVARRCRRLRRLPRRRINSRGHGIVSGIPYRLELHGPGGSECANTSPCYFQGDSRGPLRIC